MKGKQVFLSTEGVAALEECKRLLEERDGVKWGQGQVLQFGLVRLKDSLETIAKAKALQAKEQT